MDLSIRTENFANDDQSWLGSAHGTDATRTITLDTSAFTSGTHYPDGYFKSGIPLGKITASGKYGPYNDAAADGTEVLAGFLFCAVDAPSVNTIDVGAAMLDHGRVVESKLPIAVNANGKADVAGRIIFA
ncbi:head decoration protein [Planobispora rosea]|uniref:head decoration protein n=1 Tax=Planobispora rosea TaxID=35762 RepID=UPI00083A6991|nr:head decoration protein [Planobispora rosea]